MVGNGHLSNHGWVFPIWIKHLHWFWDWNSTSSIFFQVHEFFLVLRGRCVWFFASFVSSWNLSLRYNFLIGAYEGEYCLYSIEYVIVEDKVKPIKCYISKIDDDNVFAGESEYFNPLSQLNINYKTKTCKEAKKKLKKAFMDLLKFKENSEKTESVGLMGLESPLIIEFKK